MGSPALRHQRHERQRAARKSLENAILRKCVRPPARHDLHIKAYNTNTGFVYVGGSDVDKTSKNGYELDADASVTLDEAWLNEVYIDATVNAEGVGYTYRSY